MNIAAILTKVPWGLVIDKAPSAIEKGKVIVSKLRNGGSKEEAVKDMAQLLEEQGELIKALSDQNNQLFEAVRTLASRQKILWGITILSLLSAVGALVLTINS